MSKTNAHDARRDGLLVVANTTILGKFVGDLAITEALLTHRHHEFVIRVQLVSDTFVISWKTLTLATVMAAESTGLAQRLLVEEAVVFIQYESFSVASLDTNDGPLETPGLGDVVGSDALALLTGRVVVVLGIVVVYVVLVLVFMDTEIFIAVELEVAIIGLPKVSDFLKVKLYTYIVSCLSSILNVVVVLTTRTTVRVIQVVLNGLRVVRLVAYNCLLEGHAGRPSTKVLTVEIEGVISHVADYSGGSGGDVYSVGTVKGDTVIDSLIVLIVLVY